MLLTGMQNCALLTLLCETVYIFLTKVNTHLQIWPSNAVPRYCPKRNESLCHTEPSAQMLIVALFITARNKNKSNTHQINKMWHIQTMEYYSAIKKKLGTNTCHDMDKLQVKEARQEKPHIVWFDLYEMSRIVKSLYGESRLLVA